MKQFTRIRRLGVILVTLAYAAGMLRQIDRPWTGLHDWNGAFYSQLARNLLRYPWEVHHGMPVAAVGQAVPPPMERSFYATHPPGLVWLLAGVFCFAGDAEWVARLVVILPALASLPILMWILARAAGWTTAITAGAIYAILPMTVFFGRMVDQEGVCLFLMLTASASWLVLDEPDSRPWKRRAAAAAACIALLAMIWIDWAGMLFAVLFCLGGFLARRRRGASLRLPAMLLALSAASIAMVVAYLVYVGMNGQWEALISLFFSRREAAPVAAFPRVFHMAADNLTWLGVVLAPLASAYSLARARHSQHPALGIGVITLTGAIWLLVFWRQFVIHQYWMFYLGPWVAASIAQAAIHLSDLWREKTGPLRKGTALAAALLFAVICVRGTNALFNRVLFPLEHIEAWKRASAMTEPDDRVLLAESPIALDPCGSTTYIFRNIFPPLAYYLDRAFDVAEQLQESELADGRHALFIVDAGKVAPAREAYRPLLSRHRTQQIGRYLIVDFRADHGRDAMSR